MSALLIPFPATCVVRNAAEQKRIAERFAVEVGKGRRRVSAEVAWKRATLAPVANDSPLSEYEVQFEKLAQMIADRARPGARKSNAASPAPTRTEQPESALELAMDPLAERIANRAKQIMAERAQAVE